MENIGNTSQVHLKHITSQQTLIAAADADYIQTFIDSGTNNCTDGCVHAGSITAAAQYADRSDSFFHMIHSFHRIVRRENRYIQIYNQITLYRQPFFSASKGRKDATFVHVDGSFLNIFTR